MNRTGIFATREEADEITRLIHVARRTPVIAVNTAHGLGSGGFAGDAWERCRKRINAIAMGHGLPEIEGYYGFDTDSHEFVSV